MFKNLGPHRIWLPNPLRAGWEEIEFVGTTSAVLPSVGEGVNLERMLVVVGARKMVGRDVARRVGRRVGREEKDLVSIVRGLAEY
jgi:hypothetical protein